MPPNGKQGQNQSPLVSRGHRKQALLNTQGKTSSNRKQSVLQSLSRAPPCSGCGGTKKSAQQQIKGRGRSKMQKRTMFADARTKLTTKEFEAACKSFKQIDTDGNHTLDMKELRRAFTKLRVKLPKEKLHSLVREVDINNEGVLGLEEFIILVAQVKVSGAHSAAFGMIARFNEAQLEAMAEEERFALWKKKNMRELAHLPRSKQRAEYQRMNQEGAVGKKQAKRAQEWAQGQRTMGSLFG